MVLPTIEALRKAGADVSLAEYEAATAKTLDEVKAILDKSTTKTKDSDDDVDVEIDLIISGQDRRFINWIEQQNSLIIEGVEDDDKSWEIWIDEITDVVKGISFPNFAGLLASLSGVSSAVLAPVLAVLATLGEHIIAIKEFISNLASDIAKGMESAFEVIGTIVVDPLLGILSAFGDYLGEKLSGFIENAVGEE